jgi:hypothetical protein
VRAKDRKEARVKAFALNLLDEAATKGSHCRPTNLANDKRGCSDGLFACLPRISLKGRRGAQNLSFMRFINV